jgi:acetyltransferase-like isoleucine patch superfamily enzyme
VGALRDYAGYAWRLSRGRETSVAAFAGGVLRHRVLSRRDIWIGSRTVLDGAGRVVLHDGAHLRIGLGPFGATSRHDTTVVRIRPGATFDCHGMVSLQRGTRVVVDGGSLSIGHGTNINGLSKIFCATSVTIGAACTLSWDVQVMDTDFHAITVDGVPRPMTDPVVIGDRVWVGTGALVLKGSRIGDGAVVAAGAVVTGEVPPGTVVAGVPARPVGTVDSWTP